MLFNSIDFAVFLPIVFLLYWFVFNRNIRLRNLLIVVASYVFYGWWDWRFLSLIIFSTSVDYSVGYRLSKVDNVVGRNVLLWISILVNLGFLGFFKYYNFFLDNFVAAFSFFGHNFSGHFLNIILPVGISFYTFQTLSYTIDVYKNKLEPTNDFIAFSAFVAFFPQLVAGPIERAKHLLPQFYTLRVFDYNKSVDGMRQILWGLFKKVVIADNCAEFANYIFSNSAQLNGSTLVLGALFFSFQIYGDFSGYSDIAIGTAKLFGFDLMRNFNFPYFSRDIAEFWRRWHISLSTWFRDYLYIPLGGSRGSVLMQVRNIFIIFVVSGFWHGANWTFIVWGALNAFYFLPLLLSKNNRRNLDIPAMGRTFPSPKELALILLTFGLTVFAWIFFRAEDLGHAFSYIQGVFSASLFEMPDYKGIRRSLFTVVLIVVFVLTEWHGRAEQFAIANILRDRKRVYRWSYYLMLVFFIYWLHADDPAFIYFQF
jgi:D-alanyl-lipoteichoic acid acyltransferase DltB (MBOAT superfamily)